MIVMEGLRKAVEEWSASRGLRPLSQEELGLPDGSPDMAFSGPKGITFVLLLGEKALGDRRYFMEVVMRASSLRDKCNFLYLAAPKLVAPFVDTEVLKKHGIGLLVVGDEGVVEALASPYRPISAGRQEKAPQVSLEALNEVLSRLSALEERLSALEREVLSVRPALSELSALRGLGEQVRALSARLDALTRRVDALSASLARPTALTAPTAPSPPTTPPSAGQPELEGLPSFFKDNPWLEILARRGQDEVPA